MGHGAGFYGGRIIAYENSPQFDYACGDAAHSYSPTTVKAFTRQFVYLRPDVFVVFDRVSAFSAEFPKTWILHTPAKPVPNAAGAEKPDTRIHPEGHFTWECDGGQMTNTTGGRLFWRTLLPDRREIRLLGGPGHDFEVEGVNRGPTEASYSKQVLEKCAVYAELANLGGWRLEVESQNRRETETFLNVLQAADADTREMVGVEKISADGRVGVRVTSGAKVFEVTFATEGAAGGHIEITDGGRTLVDRDLATEVRDTYAQWKDAPQYREWMTSPHMRSVIGAAEQDAFGGGVDR
jgi:heparin/heparan-sulfate lyase